MVRHLIGKKELKNHPTPSNNLTIDSDVTNKSFDDLVRYPGIRSWFRTGSNFRFEMLSRERVGLFITRIKLCLMKREKEPMYHITIETDCIKYWKIITIRKKSSQKCNLTCVN